MRKLISIIAVVFLAFVSAATAATIWVNLQSQTVGVPDAIDNVSNPIFWPEFLYTKDYRQADEPVSPAEGYERLTPVTWIQDTNDVNRAVAVYHDTSIAERIARQHAQDLALNAPKYTYQDTFLLVCDTLTGSTNHNKLPLDNLTIILLQVKAVDKAKYENLRDGLSMLNTGLNRYSVAWWDTCSWESNTNIVSAATNLFNLMAQ